MTDCNQLKIEFPACRGRRVEVDFAGGDISSNGGAGLLDLAERRLGLLSELARRLEDPRRAGKVEHQLLALLRQRVFAVALGYEDVNDHDDLRHDLVLQTARGRDGRLASSSTIGRLERGRTGPGLGLVGAPRDDGGFYRLLRCGAGRVDPGFLRHRRCGAWPPGRPLLPWLP